MKITRTYPTPDDPRPHIGPRERALAVFKYLRGLEPEQAVGHPLFPHVEADFRSIALTAHCDAVAVRILALVERPTAEQEALVMAACMQQARAVLGLPTVPSIVPELSGQSPELQVRVRPFGGD